MVTSSEIRAKKQAQLLQESQNKGVAAGTHREALLDLLPDGADFDSIRDAVLAPAAAVDAASLSDQQKDDLRQFQMDNAFLQAEVTVLQKKLAYQKIATKQHAWAEAVLVRMDDKTLKKLKNRYLFRLRLADNVFPKLEFLSKVWGVSFPSTGETTDPCRDGDDQALLSHLVGDCPNDLTLRLDLQPTMEFYNQTGYTELGDDWTLSEGGRAIPGDCMIYSLSNRLLLSRWHYFHQ